MKNLQYSVTQNTIYIEYFGIPEIDSIANMAAAYLADRIVDLNALNSVFSLYLIFVTKSPSEFPKRGSTKIISLIWLTLSRAFFRELSASY